jgi:hypothetical protein
VANASGLKSGFIIPVVSGAMIILLQIVMRRTHRVAGGQVSTINK